MRALPLILAALVLAGGWVWVSAAADDRARSGDARSAPSAEAERRPSRTPAPTATPRPRRLPPLRASTCPAGLPRCASVRGRVLYVERVDPDGDGDLHVVLAAGSVSGPGFTAVDIAPELRPRRDPRVGDTVSAAGQVQRGSYGQSQIHAVEVHFRPRAQDRRPND